MPEIPGDRPEVLVQGIAASQGIAFGQVFLYLQNEVEVPDYVVEPDKRAAEVARFEQALLQTRQEISGIQSEVEKNLGPDEARIFDAHLMVLEDQALIGETVRAFESTHHNIETCFSRISGKYIKAFDEIDDENLRERASDIRDVAQRVLRNLLGQAARNLSQLADKRIIFAIPYERDFTLIGTTDVPYEGEPGPVTISESETDYLCGCINRSFDTTLTPADVVWSYSGVRPLYDDAAENASAVTRDYVLDVEDQGGTAAVLSVFGGKITTYRRLAEHALEKLKPYFPHLKKAWTGDAVLPGGAMKDADFDRFLAELRAERPFLPEETARRLARAYGTRTRDIVGTARSMADLGEVFDGGLTAAEVDYLRTEEWAVTADDILWRRSKLGLRTGAESAARLAAYLDRRAEAA